jgi:hypothetical protein
LSARKGCEDRRKFCRTSLDAAASFIIGDDPNPKCRKIGRKCRNLPAPDRIDPRRYAAPAIHRFPSMRQEGNLSALPLAALRWIGTLNA